MTKNEIVGRLKDGGLDASSTNRSSAVYVTDARSGRAEAGWFAYRIVCNREEMERRARAILSRWYEIKSSGDVWRLKSKNRIPLMAIKRGAAPAEKSPLWFEAAQANSTVNMMALKAEAPDLEYSNDGETWQPWEYTDQELAPGSGIFAHFFDTITLGEVGDKVYFRGDNPDGLGSNVPFIEGQIAYSFSFFQMTGILRGGGDVTSLLDKDNIITEIPSYGFLGLFSDLLNDVNTSLINPFDMSFVTKIGDYGCMNMYGGCTSLTAAADMPLLTHIGDYGCGQMYTHCNSITATASMPLLVSIGEQGCGGMYTHTSITAAEGMAQVTSFGDNSLRYMYIDTPNNAAWLLNEDKTALAFDFPQLPITTTGGATYSTPLEVATWMGYVENN